MPAERFRSPQWPSPEVLAQYRANGAIRHHDPNAPTAVYRFYDSAGRLLYVGMTHNPTWRFKFHVHKNWWPRAVRHTIDWRPNRAAAAREERRAILEECPLHNRHGLPRRRQVNPIDAVRLSMDEQRPA
ncbi:hypothetical protein GT755_12345 [Herbidospora sp. NEAU-GS84]|uniref:GIY-YIG domain-containing protein n=1 Tax=Herbidospora solisilvae TaxID=2696284 RepID=A0A7C9NHA3_9ACTN|nr:hypothetical protein [Herbidospora solisilvae]NAS22472.1 hypothetical protein [Herbidospora solisilvae]